MRHYQTIALLGSLIISIGLANCTSRETTSTDRAKVDAVVMEVPVIPDDPPASHEPSGLSERSGEIQERGVTGTFTPGEAVLGGLSLPLTSAYPGEFAFRTQKGFYLTAINGGGRIADPIVVTSATAAGAWEKFKLAIATPPSAYDKTIQTATGNYLTAVNGGGMTANVLHTDATQPRDWERFRLVYIGGFPPPFYGIGTIKGNFLTAVGSGGEISGCSAQRRQADPGLGTV
jgi:hypothetical protein